jgi:hypothetical protein
MLVDFEKLPETARVWIYQANRSFSGEELSSLRSELIDFLEQWTAHGSQLKAGFEMPYNRFIVIGLDQTLASASGCSIDASVRFIQAVQSKYNIELLDKMNVSYKQGDFVAYKSLQDFRQMAKDKAITKSTIVFNNLVINKEEYTHYWEVPASESWHARFF